MALGDVAWTQREARQFCRHLLADSAATARLASRRAPYDDLLTVLGHPLLLALQCLSLILACLGGAALLWTVTRAVQHCCTGKACHFRLSYQLFTSLQNSKMVI